MATKTILKISGMSRNCLRDIYRAVTISRIPLSSPSNYFLITADKTGSRKSNRLPMPREDFRDMALPKS